MIPSKRHQNESVNMRGERATKTLGLIVPLKNDI